MVLGLVFVGTLFVLVLSSTLYPSTWMEENSNFYENATKSLRLFSLNPTAPTIIIFWDKDDSEALETLKFLENTPSSVRIYGVHLSNTDDLIGVRKAWIRNTPHRSVMMMDRSEILQTTFLAKTVPCIFLILPKQKKIYSLSFPGRLMKGQKKMLELIHSEALGSLSPY